MHQSGWAHGPSDLPEAVDRDDMLPEVVPPGHPHSAYDQDKHLAPGYSPYGYQEPPTQAATGTPPPRGIWTRRKWIILAVILGLVVVGVGLGVGLGIGLRSSSSGDPAPAASPSETPDNNGSNGGSSAADSAAAGNLFEGSSLAATNYTDTDGFIHLYVFFQAANKELLTSQWDSENKTWSTMSISKILSSTGLTLNLIPASPIAAYTYTNPTFQTRVYFLTTGNSIREIISSEDPTLATNWRQGQLGSNKLITAAEGSKLAALRPHCGTSRNCQFNYPWMALAYQGDGGVIAVTRADDWEAMDLPFGPAERGAVIGLSSVMRNNNITDVEWSLFYDEDGKLQEFNSENRLGDWIRGASTGFAPSPSGPNIASFSYELVNMMIINVDPDGDLEIRTWDTKAWSGLDPPNLLAAEGVPAESKFAAVAGTSQRRVFGVVNGTVHQWEFFTLSPRQWGYVGTVPTDLKP